MISPECPVPVVHPVMRMWWDELTFLHWRFDPSEVQRLLPDGLSVETFDGEAYVGLVPFLIRVALPGTRPVPWLSVFPETNVRTYVVGPNGEAGVWFFSLDAARSAAVATARITYRLPYMWSDMSITHAGDVLAYRCRRRWGSADGLPPHPTSEVAVRVGEQLTADELGDLDHWLTARWALWSAPRSGLRWARAEHPVWPLYRAEVLHLHDELVAASGLPQPTDPPIVHWSPSVEVRVSRPQRP